MRKVFFLLLFVTGLFAANAQKNLQPGFVVLNNGDSIRGFVDHLEWHRNPSSVLFTLSKQGEMKRYSVKQLQYFEVTGEVAFQKFGINISLDPVLFSDLAEKNISNKNDSVFLKVIHRGKNVSLYSFKDELKIRWYVQLESATIPQELLNSTYKVNGQIMNERQFRAQWLGIASVYRPDDETLAMTITKSGYTQKTFLSICYSINDVNPEKFSINKKTRFVFFAGGGANMGSLTFTGGNMFAGLDASRSVFPVIGGGVDIVPIPAVGRLFIRNQVTFTKFTSDLETEPADYYAASEQYYFKFTQLNTTINPTLNYNFYNGPNFKWFVGAGVGFNFSQYPRNERTLVRTGLNENVTTTENYLKTLNFWMNFSTRTGVEIKRFEISVAFFPKAAISDYANFSLDNSSTQLQLNYVFRQKRGS